MRLINTHTLALEEFFDDDIPLYAIRSHTWSKGEEVSFQEMQMGQGLTKKGYAKIKSCASWPFLTALIMYGLTHAV
jgi:hypothetical protein